MLDWIDQTDLNNENYDAPNLTPYLNYIDGFIVNNKYAKEKYEKQYNKFCHIIRHHWDPRIKNFKNYNMNEDLRNLKKVNILLNGYVGHKNKNCLYLKELSDSKIVDHCGDFKHLYDKHKNYNCHISIREPNSWEYLNKPSIKLFGAAALNCNIITTDDIGVREILHPDYPYLLRDVSYENVLKMIKYVNDTYNTDVWFKGLDMLKEIKHETSIENIVKNYYIPFFDEFVNTINGSSTTNGGPLWCTPPPDNISLTSLCDNKKTDKNTVHSYLPLYQELLSPARETAKNVLEVGVAAGGSIKLWHDFFTNATVYGIDIVDIITVEEIRRNNRIALYTSNNAYDEVFFKKQFLDKNIKFDFMIDDGPHTLESMKHFVTLYSQIMTDNGILIVEDLKELRWVEELANVTPENLKPYIQAYDLRRNKNRYDDIVFVINRNK